MFSRKEEYGDLRDHEYRKIENKIVTDTAHGCFTYIAAAIMIFVGILTLTDGDEYFYLGLALFVGGLLIAIVNGIAPYFGLLEKRKKKYPKKYYLYAAVIGDYKNTPIQLFVNEFNENEKNVIVNLQEMIHTHFLFDAYIDNDSKELIIESNEVVRKEKEYCPNCGSEIKKKTKYCMMCGFNFEEDLLTEQDKAIKKGKGDLIDTVFIDNSVNQELIEQASEYNSLLTGLLKRIETNPEILENRDVKAVLNLYAPKIKQVADNYRAVVLQNITDEKRAQLEKDLCSVFEKENNALIELNNKLNEEDIMDISADIDAIIEKLGKDGYTTKKDL